MIISGKAKPRLTPLVPEHAAAATTCGETPQPRSPNFLPLLLAALLLAACGKRSDPGDSTSNNDAGRFQSGRVETVPFASRPAPAETRFAELGAAETGIDFVNPIDENHPLRYLYSSAMSTGGAAIADFDGDGKQDVFLAGGAVANKLFRQTARMKFEDVTAKAGVGGGSAWAVGCAFGDIDGDGDSDLYVCNYVSPNQLFLNNGDGSFTEAAKAHGVDFTDASHTPSFCDYDRDGDLDLYVMTNRWYREEGFPQEQTIEIGPNGPRVRKKYERYYAARQTGDDKWESHVVGRPDLLCRNDGSGKFEVVNESAGIRHRGHGLSATWWDWNGDGWTDLWVGNDFQDEDRIYLNRGPSDPDGQVTFLDVTRYVVGHLTWYSMGADFGDLNGDGLADFLIADMAGSTHFKQKTAMGSMEAFKWFMDNARPAQLMRNALYLNAGNGRFLEGAYLAGLASTDWTWAVRLCDFDHDGRNDAFFQCGMSRNFNERDDEELKSKDRKLTQWERFRHLPPLKEKNRVFRNLGGMKFADASEDWGLDHFGMSYGCAVGDLDGDGALDIVSVRLDGPVVVKHNTGADAGNSITMAFRGTESNSQGIGVQARLFAGAKDEVPQVRTLITARGYLGSDQPMLHFGLGEAETVARVELFWPSGASQVLENLDAGFHYIVSEHGETGNRPTPAPKEGLFVREKALAQIKHSEVPFDDFNREPLLPNKLSQLGPGQAWGDIDGDGLDDLYLGGAKGSPRYAYLRQSDGSFKPRPIPQDDTDRQAEDMGALLFDADADGDQDLYVVSGGVECDEGAACLQDRLYFNDGSGNFIKAPPGYLPNNKVSGSSISAADFDRDGDLDLFVGGRSIPGKYPLAAVSLLLRNEGGGKFSDVTGELAPALAGARAGIVTGAVWSDLDGDGWIDLALSRDWGTIAIFRNQGGTLVPLHQGGPSAAATGWWNGITAGDLDGDGDFDLVATNFGRNTKYHLKPGKPALLFYGDVDDSGKSNLLEAEYEGNRIVPIRGKSCSTAAIPSLADKYGTFREFALASLFEIYPRKKLDTLRRYEAENLNTSVFWNDGSGNFTPSPLPWEAQLSPSFGVVVRDIDGDGNEDIVLAQNFFTPQRETGRMAGGLSLLLLGKVGEDGRRSFQPVWPGRSGINVPGDAKSLAAPDLNGDRSPDLSFGNNDSPMDGFLQKVDPAGAGGRHIAVRLQGSPANPTAVGARVTLNGRQHAEVRAGAGYLSQSPPTLYFGRGDSEILESVTVRWPDGTVSDFQPPQSGDNKVLVLRKK